MGTKHFFALFFVGLIVLSSFYSQGAQATQIDVANLKKHVKALVEIEGYRYYNNRKGIDTAINYIVNFWKGLGLRVEEQIFRARDREYKNLVVSFGPPRGDRIVVGAHYDVAGQQCGADDNASGIAGLLELSRLLAEKGNTLQNRIDLVAYTLEEPPFFATTKMGSYQHAKALYNQGIKVKLMLSLEMIGYFTDTPDSQKFPVGILKYLFPSTGNFIGVIGDSTTFWLGRWVRDTIKGAAAIDAQSMAAPSFLVGVDFSDHRSYASLGYPSLMITDTSFYRNPNYHEPTDTIDTLNFNKMAEVVKGVHAVVKQMQ